MGKKATCAIILIGAIILSFVELLVCIESYYIPAYYSGTGYYGAYSGTTWNYTLYGLLLLITWAIAIGAMAYVANKPTFTGGIKYCEKCGKKNSTEAKLCRNCGKEF